MIERQQSGRPEHTIETGREKQNNHENHGQTAPFPNQGSTRESSTSQRLATTRESLNGGLSVLIRERELNTNLFFSNFSGAPGISQQNLGISRQKVWFPWVSKDIPKFLAPIPSCGNPHPTRKYPDQKVWVWVSFSSLTYPQLSIVSAIVVFNFDYC